MGTCRYGLGTVGNGCSLWRRLACKPKTQSRNSDCVVEKRTFTTCDAFLWACFTTLALFFRSSAVEFTINTPTKLITQWRIVSAFHISLRGNEPSSFYSFEKDLNPRVMSIYSSRFHLSVRLCERFPVSKSKTKDISH